MTLLELMDIINPFNSKDSKYRQRNFYVKDSYSVYNDLSTHRSTELVAYANDSYELIAKISMADWHIKEITITGSAKFKLVNKFLQLCPQDVKVSWD